MHSVAVLPHSNNYCSATLNSSQVTKDKDAAVRGQDFEKAGQLRDREMELKAKISAIIAGAKEQGKAEAESVEGGGPQVRLLGADAATLLRLLCHLIMSATCWPCVPVQCCLLLVNASASLLFWLLRLVIMHNKLQGGVTAASA
jgi:hypothetical protein